MAISKNALRPKIKKRKSRGQTTMHSASESIIISRCPDTNNVIHEFFKKIFGKHFKYVRLSLSFDMPSDMPEREVKRILDDTKIKECDFLFFFFSS